MLGRREAEFRICRGERQKWDGGGIFQGQSWALKLTQRLQESHDHNRMGDSLWRGQKRPGLGQAGAQQAGGGWKGVSEEF